MGGELLPNEEEALVAFADKFVTCTLNPDMAAKMIDEKVTAEEGEAIVKIAKETQTHHHTKTCKKCHQIVDLVCQDFQCGKPCLLHR